MFFYVIEMNNMRKIIDIIVMNNLYIKFLNYFIMNDCYRFFQAKNSLKCFKLLQKNLNVDVVKFENRNMRCFLSRT